MKKKCQFFYGSHVLEVGVLNLIILEHFLHFSDLIFKIKATKSKVDSGVVRGNKAH